MRGIVVDSGTEVCCAFLRPMRTALCLVALVVLLDHSVPAEVRASLPPAREIKPPFGLKWGETPQRLEELLTGAKAKIVAKKDVAGELVFEVEGLVQTGLARTLFCFRQEKLTRVALVYERLEWDPARFEQFYKEVEQRITNRYADGEEKVTPGEGRKFPREKLWKLGTASMTLRLYEIDEADPTRGLRMEVTYAQN